MLYCLSRLYAVNDLSGLALALRLPDQLFPVIDRTIEWLVRQDQAHLIQVQGFVVDQSLCELNSVSNRIQFNLDRTCLVKLALVIMQQLLRPLHAILHEATIRQLARPASRDAWTHLRISPSISSFLRPLRYTLSSSPCATSPTFSLKP